MDVSSLLRLHCLPLAQSLLDVVLDLSSALQSKYLVDYLAITTDIESRRQELNSTVGITNCFLADEDRIIHA
jgi:hypothetical protein